MSKQLTALVDLDAMLHIIANVQWSAGNKDDEQAVENHVTRFISNVVVNADCKDAILFFQGSGHKNFRNELLPEYKQHRKTTEAIERWKPVILKGFTLNRALELKSIESDDAIGIVANQIGYDKVVIITSDKDMIQIPSLIYNPYKKNLSAEDRWYPALSTEQAEAFFYQQVLTGDPTDMPGELCGIEGVGPATAKKMLDCDDDYPTILERAYTKKYGDAGFARCKLTYKMVKLLRDSKASYLPPEAHAESEFVEKHYKDYIQTYTDPISDLFEPVNPVSSANNVQDLFNNFKNE